MKIPALVGAEFMESDAFARSFYILCWLASFSEPLFICEDLGASERAALFPSNTSRILHSKCVFVCICVYISQGTFAIAERHTRVSFQVFQLLPRFVCTRAVSTQVGPDLWRLAPRQKELLAERGYFKAHSHDLLRRV